MNTLRHGKIARLPRAIREELNQRLEDDGRTDEILAWLNGLPEVQAMLAADFGGHPVAAQNLSQWRRGGYRAWHHLRQAQKLAWDLRHETLEDDPAGSRKTMDALATWLTASYTLDLALLEELEGPERLRLLRFLTRDLDILLRRNHAGTRVDLAREKLALRRMVVEARVNRANTRTPRKPRPTTPNRNIVPTDSVRQPPDQARPNFPAETTPLVGHDRRDIRRAHVESACPSISSETPAPTELPATAAPRHSNMPSDTTPLVGHDRRDIRRAHVESACPNFPRTTEQPTATPNNAPFASGSTPLVGRDRRARPNIPSENNPVTNPPATAGPACPNYPSNIPSETTPPNQPPATREIQAAMNTFMDEMSVELAEAKTAALRHAAASGEFRGLTKEAVAERIEAINAAVNDAIFERYDLVRIFSEAIAAVSPPEHSPSATAATAAPPTPPSTTPTSAAAEQPEEATPHLSDIPEDEAPPSSAARALFDPDFTVVDPDEKPRFKTNVA